MGELAVGAVDLAPLVVELDDLGHLLGKQAVHGAAAATTVFQLAIGPALHPAVGPDLVEFEIPAPPPHAPPRLGGVGDEVEQGCRGERVDTSGTRPLSPSAFVPPPA